MAVRRSPKGRNRNDSAAGASSSSDAAQSTREDSAVPGVGDGELVLRIAARDEEALRLLVEAMRVPIFTFARQIVLDDHLAEEVTQDTFLVVWENAPGFEVGRRVVPWVFAIARNLARTAARSAARRSKRLAAAGRWADIADIEVGGVHAGPCADPHAEVEGALLDVAVVGIFFERIFRYLPVTSANLCAYQLAGLIRHDADRSDVRDLVARWKRICPDILVALVANENGQVVVASEAVLEGKDIPTSCLENRKALKLWISQVAPGAGLHSDRVYHIGSAEARSAARGRSYRIWVVCPPVLCTSWVVGAIMITHAPNAEWGLWSLIWWLSVPTWMYLDRVVATGKADRSAVLWALAGLVGNGLALLVYLAALHRRRCAIGKASDSSRR
ncbi:MAG: RNA polymerase sigma factor [Bacteroidota bacterium]